MQKIIETISIGLSLAICTGVFMHESKVDSLAVTAALPAVVAGYGIADVTTKFADSHTHVERVSVGSQPSIQPRGDDRKYMSPKRLAFSGGTEFGYIWPSA